MLFNVRIPTIFDNKNNFLSLNHYKDVTIANYNVKCQVPLSVAHSLSWENIALFTGVPLQSI